MATTRVGGSLLRWQPPSSAYTFRTPYTTHGLQLYTSAREFVGNLDDEHMSHRGSLRAAEKGKVFRAFFMMSSPIEDCTRRDPGSGRPAASISVTASRARASAIRMDDVLEELNGELLSSANCCQFGRRQLMELSNWANWVMVSSEYPMSFSIEALMKSARMSSS